MPQQPTAIEKDAVQLAKQFREFIDNIRLVNQNTPSEEIKRLKQIYIELSPRSDSILEQIVTIENGNSEVQSYYYLYLLQQISRFNQYLNSITQIRDNRKNLIEKHVVCRYWAGFLILKKNGIKGIQHPLLNQPPDLTMEVIIRNNESIFREPYKYDDDGQRFYYNQKSTLDGKPHQDRDHYHLANRNIALATQRNNLTGFFSGPVGQGLNHYFKPANKNQHANEQKLFRSAINNIQQGAALSDDEGEVLKNGKFYRFPKTVKFKIPSPAMQNNVSNTDYQITHLGHASEVITWKNKIPLHLTIDPVHYQSGTDPNIKPFAKVLYDRYTDPAFATHGYPAMNVVLVSHNHYDHMCVDSLKEAFGDTNVLFIVPAGDAKHMIKFGLCNVIELTSWNDSVEITLKSGTGESSQYEIRSFPAKHASNRGLSDLYESLYMGYMIREVTKKEIILCTGDTAVLDEEHFSQLHDYLLKNNFTIKTACIAHGPDRPRQWMECTHQSTADALTMHAKFTVMNAHVFAQRQNKPLDMLSFAEIQEAACYSIGYHQGCYRLGLLSHSDVDTTILRILAVLSSFKVTPIDKITEDILTNNLFYQFMDKFEQDALRSTLEVYRTFKVAGNCLNANQIKMIITAHLHIPQPGYQADFSNELPYTGFQYDYERLILNRDPDRSSYDDFGYLSAYEFFAYHLEPKFYLEEPINEAKLISNLLSIHMKRLSLENCVSGQVDDVHDFLLRLTTISPENICCELGKLYKKIYTEKDESVRDEGHPHTAILIVAGLIFDTDFRKKFHKRHLEMHHSANVLKP